MTITLKGMTWRHPRGYDPMVATSAQWQQQTGVAIAWDQRSLQDFETFPVEDLARQYDLIVIDHPHVGQITKEGCLAPLDVPGCEAERADMAAHSVGQSYPSYHFAGHQWAFPIDAAAQVQVYRSDLLPKPVTSWAEAAALARMGKVILPMRAPHSLMSFFTLAANLGTPCRHEGAELIALDDGIRVIETLRQVTDHIAPDNFDMDPIAAYEVMATGDQFSLMPLGYGYVSYALDGFRLRRLKFADIPAAGSHGPVGSAIGGTGIAVSAFSEHREAAVAYAYWVASAATQAGLYAQSGGQPGHGLAWEREAVNAPVDNFYRDTRQTLEGGWLRPRHDGYMPFQDAASGRLNQGLVAGEDAASILSAINTMFGESF
ncbi:MAG TPA: extracellular solute-binding protein [Devosia sp.]|jgi:multiple sugar transport system substrate-binding protein|uniref:extracellular solute-binding protein n=1 Tax=Devosia sp. TaxID=1871048 RepID=UPI002F956E8F